MPLGVSITFEEYKSLKKINQKKAIIAIARTINEFIYYIFSINIK